MTENKWKPGDVAMLRLDAETEIRVSRERDGWRGAKGTFYDPALSARPLVVIDPEDREQVEQLSDAYWKVRLQDRTRTDALQAALRNLAKPTPPKPEEPTGLGAVVEDTWGHLYVRTGSQVAPWCNVREEQTCTWDHVNAVCVLSEGVTA